MDTSELVPDCPFCGFRPNSDQQEYEMLMHMETMHAESQSPFIATGTLICPHDGCREVVEETELEHHLLLHQLEAEDDYGLTEDRESVPQIQSRDKTKMDPPPDGLSVERTVSDGIAGPKRGLVRSWREMLSARGIWGISSTTSGKTHHKSPAVEDKTLGVEASPGETNTTLGKSGSQKRPLVRLGKSELGRYAHEDQMPPWLISILEKDNASGCSGVLPVLAQLFRHAPSTQECFLCHPLVQHVSKLRREGGFCGYRNIQMLSSYVIDAEATGYEHFGERFPTIFQIQDLIENAWDHGFNSQGRLETGGIKGTRKYIGTPEAQALFCSLEIPCSVEGFRDSQDRSGYDRLFRAIEGYFRAGAREEDHGSTVRCTPLPPIYFQYPGHSLTIVGFERQKDGRSNLIVFDPSFRDSNTIQRLLGKNFKGTGSAADDALKAYRRGHRHLRKYGEFEVLYLTKYRSIQ